MTINITGIKPFYHQRKVIEELKKGTETVVVCSSRQKGKSLLTSNCLLYFALNRPKTKNYYIAPTLRQSKALFEIIVNGVAASGVIKSKNATDLTITFINGSQILCKSAEQGDNLRGFSAHFLCIDEAAYIPDQVFYIIAPWRDAYKAQTLICSTPFTRNGFFFQHYAWGKNGENGCVTVDWSDEEFRESIEQILPPDRLEQYRLMLPRRIFEQEYLGHFLDDDGAVFTNLSNCLRETKIGPNDRLFAGIDWANQGQGDYTVLSIFNQNGNQVYLRYWNSLTPLGQIDVIYNELEPYLRQIQRVTAETNSIGTPYTDLLKQKNPLLASKIQGFVTTNQSKNAAVVNFQTALEQGTATLLPDEKQRSEFAIFSADYNPKTRNVSYAAPQGLHDDTVLAALLAWDGYRLDTTTGNYDISVRVKKVGHGLPPTLLSTMHKR